MVHKEETNDTIAAYDNDRTSNINMIENNLDYIDDDNDDEDINDENQAIIDNKQQQQATSMVNVLNGHNNIVDNMDKDDKKKDDELPTILDYEKAQLDEHAPRDWYQLVHIIFILHGIAILMPWNMFINAAEYFTDYKLTHRFQNGTIVESEYKEYFLSNLGIAAQVPNVLFNFFNFTCGFGKKDEVSKGLTIRILAAIFIELIFIIITVILALIDTSNWMSIFFYLTMATVVILNSVNAIYQNSFYGLGSRLPMRYTNAIITGTNICGTFTAIMNIITIALSPDKRIAAVYFFSSAIIILIFAFISFLMLRRNKFFQYYLHQQSSNDNDSTTDIEMKTKTLKSTENETLLIGSSSSSTTTTSTPASSSCMDNTKSSDTSKNKTQNPDEMTKSELLHYVFKSVKHQCLNVFLVFFVTLSTFPVIQSNIRPIDPEYLFIKEWTDKFYVAVCCFLVFNVFALIGNIAPACVMFPGLDRLWVPITLRFLFIPFFMLCNFAPTKRTWPVLIQSDNLYLFGSILMAFSSGYYSSLSMMYASISAPSKKYAGLAGMMAAASLILGIFCGVNFSTILVWLLRYQK